MTGSNEDGEIDRRGGEIKPQATLGDAVAALCAKPKPPGIEVREPIELADR